MAKRKPVKKATKRKAPAKVTSVRKDARGRYHDQKGRPVAAARAKRFKTFVDAAGRRRATKGGKFAKGTKLQAASRERIRSAFRPANPIERARRVEKLPRKLPRGAAGKVRIRGAKKGKRRGGRASELEKLFGVRFRNVGDFAELVERDGRELGRASLHVDDPVGGRAERSVEQAVRRATTRALAKVKGVNLVAITTTTSVHGEEIGRETVFVRPGERDEVVGGVMTSIFRALREAGYDASGGAFAKERGLEEVDEIDAEIVVYELE